MKKRYNSSMKASRFPNCIEVLEARIAPASLNVAGGVATYTAVAGESNAFALSINGSDQYVFSDGPTITLTAAAITSGFTGSGTSTVKGPNAAVSSIVLVLGDQNDQVAIDGLADPLSVDTGTGTADSIVVATNALTVNGALTLAAESITISAPINAATTVLLAGDSIALNAAISASTKVTLQPFTATADINLGAADSAGVLGLTDAELDRVTAPLLQIGVTAGSIDIIVSAAISPANASTLRLISTGSITATGSGSITVANLAVTSKNAVTLGGANNVSVLAGQVTTSGQNFAFTDATGFAVGTVDGIVGITVPPATAIILNAGPVTQQAGAGLHAGFLSLLGTGPFTLTEPTNDIATIGANIGGVLNYVDVNDLFVGLVATTNGIVTSNDNVSLTTIDGDIHVTDQRSGADINTGGGATVTLTAGSAAGQDRSLILDVNAGVTGTGGITFIADHMSLGAAINAGVQLATLRPFELATSIDLGGADAATKLGLTDAELDFITADTLKIGRTVGTPIFVSGAISPANTTTLSLLSATNITEGVAGSVQIANLAIVGNGVNLGSATNQVGTIAGSAPGSFTTAFLVSSSVALTVGTVDGIFGITTASGGVILTADTITLNEVIMASGAVALKAATAARTTNLGTKSAGSLSFTSGELGFVHAPTLRLGSATAGALTVSAALSRAGATELIASGSIAVSAALTLGTATFTAPVVNVTSGGSLTAAGTSSGSINVLAGGSLAPGDGPGRLTATDATFAATSTFAVELNGPVAGTQHDQFTIAGTVNLGGATFVPTLGFPVGRGEELIIIDHGGNANPVIGTFAALPNGAILPIGGVLFSINYAGGDGNDVTLTPVPLTVSQLDAKTVTFTDIDGDLVTVKSSIGAFAGDGSEFIGVETGANSAGVLQQLKLGPAFKGANLTITAKPTVNGGNGFVNLGFLDAIGVDLGTVSIAGDLGRIGAGTVGGDVHVPVVKSLTVQSFGLLGTATQGTDTSSTSVLHGALPKFTVKDDFRDATFLLLDADGKLGAVSIGGSLVANGFTKISAVAGIGSLKVGGDIRASAGSGSPLEIASGGGAIGAITVGGNIVGAPGLGIAISAFGQTTAPARGLDLALKSLTVKGSVEFLTIAAGAGDTLNADASIGAISVGGDWIASSAAAGVKPNANGFGNNDDALFTGGRNKDTTLSTIGSFTVKGQALGTNTSTTDMFGVVAERIGKAKVGGRTFAFVADKGATLHREAFFAAPTLGGAGAENPVFDFTIRELGSTTPTVALATDFDLGDGKTVTFTDVDGDHVTVKRTVGVFTAGDFTFAAATLSGGGLLTSLALTSAPGNLTITAKPGPDGGNGLVNITEIDATGLDLGAVSIAGDLFGFLSGSGSSAPGLKSLTVRSAGLLTEGGTIVVFGGLAKFTAATDVRGIVVATGRLGSATLGGSLVGGPLGNGKTGILRGHLGIGTVKIAGDIRSNDNASFSSGQVLSDAGALGSVSIGGDLVGTDINPVLIAGFGQANAPARGGDIALKSLSVRGSVEKASIQAGIDSPNADASIGTITIGHAWLASSVLAGIEAGTDNAIGTSDDQKIFGGMRDLAARFSSIASITIKGQALGSTAIGDSFGIVAEQIGKAKIGSRTFRLDRGEGDLADTFALSPTGPGPAPDSAASDFFLLEIPT